MFWASPGGAQVQRDVPLAEKSICVDPTRNLPQTGGTYVLDWQDMMCLEHNGRARLMRRISMNYPIEQRPQFSEFIVGRERLPSVFRRDVPLLRVVFPESSFFDTASAKIRPDAVNILRIIIEGLKGQSPDVVMFVVGHTDDRGGTEYNYNLSVDRSASVTSMLKTMGVGPTAIWRAGFGESVPLVRNDDPALMAVNRRVEFIFGARADPIAVWLEEDQPHRCKAPADAASTACKRMPPPRAIVATAETNRTLVEARPGLAVRPDPQGRRAKLNRDRKAAIAAPDQMSDSLKLDDSGKRHVELIAPNKMVLRMVPQKRVMEKPTRF